MNFPCFFFLIAVAASARGDSLVESLSLGDSTDRASGRVDSLAAPVRQVDSTVQPTRAPQYEPVIQEAGPSPSKNLSDMSLAFALNAGRLATYGVRLDYGIRREKSRFSVIGAFGVGYTGKTRVMRMNAGIGACFSQTFLQIGRICTLASGCGLGFWTIRDYPPDPFFESFNDPNARSTEKSGPFVQNEWFLLNTRAEFSLRIVHCFANADLLLSPRRFTPCLGAGVFFPLGCGESTSRKRADHEES
jgi:hypothetical protein